MNISLVQERNLHLVNDGKIIAYQNDKGKWCFKDLNNGTVLYSTLSLRALVKRGLVCVLSCGGCILSRNGRDIIGV